MTKTVEAAGYIIQDRQGNAIQGTGETVDIAWAEVVANAGPFEDAYGNIKSNEDAFADFKVYGATAALLKQVEKMGGAISWGMVSGVACTSDEEQEAND